MSDRWIVLITEGPFKGDYWPASDPEDAFACVRELREDAAREGTPLGTIEIRHAWRSLTATETISPPWTGTTR